MQMLHNCITGHNVHFGFICFSYYVVYVASLTILEKTPTQLYYHFFSYFIKIRLIAQ